MARRPAPRRKGRSPAGGSQPRRPTGAAKRPARKSAVRGANRGARGTGSGPRRGPMGGDRSRAAPRGLGGEQVEGRHAVRELLLAGTRKVRELWLSTEQEPAAVLDDIQDVWQPFALRFAAVARGELEVLPARQLPLLGH